MKRTLRDQHGLTLVELVVCMVLLAIFTVSTIALIQPCAEMFLQIQNLSRSQIIADNILDQLRGELMYAEDYIRITNAGGIPAVGQTESQPTDAPFTTPMAMTTVKEGEDGGSEVEGGATSEKEEVNWGNAIEFRSNNYTVLIDAGVIPKTVRRKTVWKGDNEAEFQDVAAKERAAGSVHYRYFSNWGTNDTATQQTGENNGGDTEVNNEYKYPYYSEDVDDQLGTKYVVFDMREAYGDGFYMKNSVELDFQVARRGEKTITENNGTEKTVECVKSIKATVLVKRGEERLYSASTIIDLVNEPEWWLDNKSPAYKK